MNIKQVKTNLAHLECETRNTAEESLNRDIFFSLFSNTLYMLEN